MHKEKIKICEQHNEKEQSFAKKCAKRTKLANNCAKGNEEMKQWLKNGKCEKRDPLLGNEPIAILQWPKKIANHICPRVP